MSDSSTTNRRRFAAYGLFVALLGFQSTQATVEANSVDDFWAAAPPHVSVRALFVVRECSSRSGGLGVVFEFMVDRTANPR